MKFISPIARLASVLCFVFSMSIFSSAEEVRPARKPNFIFILADDLGWKDLGCYGSTFFKTPNIDRLASEGVKFTDAYAACPVCSPTRASILTGKYPARLHLTDWLPGQASKPDQKLQRPNFLNHLPLEEETIAEKLKMAGYVTATIGKWHLGGAGFEPEKQGFDLNIAGNAAGTPASYFFPYQSKRGNLPKLEQGKKNEYLTDRLTDEALKFFETNQTKPFFLYLPHFAVHTPLIGKPKLIAKYRDAIKSSAAQTNAVYAAMIESLDESVGRILEKLKQLKLSDNTIVFFTSDNGGLSSNEGGAKATSNAPLRDGKGYLHEGGIRVPLIVKWPGGTKAKSVCDTPVSSIDYFSTITEMVRGEATKNPTVDGVSLVPLLKQTTNKFSRELYWHYPHYSNQGGVPSGAIRDGDFKLIENYETGRLELYNLKDDLSETKNLANENAKKANELEQKLDLWRRNVDAQMMLPNPDYKKPVKINPAIEPRKLL